MGSRGFRGYISSRPFCGERVPQHIQNIVIREYCAKKNIPYLLSATEVAMRDGYLMLTQLLDGIRLVDGIAFYSMLQLPPSLEGRQNVYSRVIGADRSIHFAVEELCLQTEQDAEQIEEIMQIRAWLPKAAEISRYDYKDLCRGP